jgi:ligand-binding sensor domain-containing protein
LLKLNSTGKKFLAFRGAAHRRSGWSLSAQQTVYFKSYTTQEGLPAGTITGLWDDPKGFLWLLSENGLSRFDGNEFIEYRNNPSDPSSLPSSTVISGHSDASGNTFFITSRAIASYSYRTETFKSILPISSTEKMLK